MANVPQLRLGRSPDWHLPRRGHMSHLLQVGTLGVRVPSSCRLAVSRRKTIATATSDAGRLNALLRHPALRRRLWRRILQLADVQHPEGQAAAHHGGPPGSTATVTADVQPLPPSLQWIDSRSAEPAHASTGTHGGQVSHFLLVR